MTSKVLGRRGVACCVYMYLTFYYLLMKPYWCPESDISCKLFDSFKWWFKNIATGFSCWGQVDKPHYPMVFIVLSKQEVDFSWFAVIAALLLLSFLIYGFLNSQLWCLAVIATTPTPADTQLRTQNVVFLWSYVNLASVIARWPGPWHVSES